MTSLVDKTRAARGVIDGDIRNQPLLEARINVSASGVSALIAAQADEQIAVEQLIIIAAAAVTVQFRDGATVLLELPLAANQGLALDPTGYPWLTTAINTALNINLSAAVSVQGRLYYKLVS